MYAQLCKRLSEEAPNSEQPGHPCTFRILLLNTCKAEFEKRSEICDKYARNPELDEEERRQMAKRKMLGNIKFIGELGKLEILSEGIIHRCIQQLLVSRKGFDVSEDLECLCQIMRTCGRILDSDKGKKLMDQYFIRMWSLAENPELQPRIRFMLKDVIELRGDGWVPRKANVVEGPVPINQIRPDEHERLLSGYRRQQDSHDHRESESRYEIFRHPIKTRSSGIDDMLMGLSISSPASNLIPTHPPFNSPNGYGNQRGNDGGGGGFRSPNNQRNSGFNNYNQRGQYKHNQNNSNNQYNNQSNKELAPRFKKNFVVTREQDLGEIQLRPSANSMVFSKATVKSNSTINNRPMDPPLPVSNSLPKAPPSLHKETVPIKQVSVEKPKQSKKDKGPNKEEILKKFTSLLDSYLKWEIDLKQAVDSYKELNVPEKFSKDIISRTLMHTIEATDENRENAVKLLSSLRKESHLNGNVIQEALKTMLNTLDVEEGGENNEPTKTVTTATKMSCAGAALIAFAVKEQLTSLSDVAALTDNGSHYPLFLYVLQRLHKLIGKNELTEVFNTSKVNLLSQLPESDRTKERLTEILEERDLTFLYPLLRIQAELAKQLQADPNPQQFYKWIKENLDIANYTDPGFINALVTVLLKYIIQEAASCASGDEKAISEKERSLLERYRPVLTAFLSEQPSLQLVAVYSLQVHFFSLGFPRGQLLRWFMAFYDLEIIEEESFLNWKEDVTDAYPGKGLALFQVHQWLTWLQEAESEEEEEEGVN